MKRLPEPYKIKMVEPLRMISREEREKSPEGSRLQPF